MADVSRFLGVHTLDLRGKRGIVDVELAKELLKPILDGEVHFDTVILSTRTIVPAAAVVVGEQLAKLPLRNALFGDCISGIPEADAFESLRALAAALKDKDIEVLDLSDNALGTKGLHCVEPMLRNRPALRELYLCNNGISADACALARDMTTDADGVCHLTTLHYYNNMSGGEGGTETAEHVRRAAASLRSFRMASTRVDAAGNADLLPALAGCRQLEALDLSDNFVGPRNVPHLLAAVRANPGITQLRLGDVALGAAAVARVAAAVAAALPRLTVLDLSANEAGPAGAVAVANALPSLPLLEELRMEDNDIGVVGVAALCRAFRAGACPALRTLTLGTNCVGARAAALLARACPALPMLTSLDLSENVFSAEAEGALRRALEAVGKGAALRELVENEEDGEEEDGDVEDEEEEDDDDEAAEGEGAGEGAVVTLAEAVEEAEAMDEAAVAQWLSASGAEAKGEGEAGDLVEAMAGMKV